MTLKHTYLTVKYSIKQTFKVISVLAAGAVLVSAEAETPASGCGIEAACSVASGTGTYRVLPPEDWDGRSLLPAAMFFHGYRGSSDAILRDAGLLDAFDRAGILLIVPDGRDGSWSHQGSPSQTRDEIAFVAEVMAEVGARWPLDRKRLWATGFSQGSSMVWDLACRGGGFSAYVAISGAFWNPIPEDCPAGPASLLQFHGFTDRTVPLEGRAIRERFHQSDVFASLDTLRRTNQCRSNPDETAIDGEIWCRLWDLSCGSGHALELCLHPGGHGPPSGWFDRAWMWVREHGVPVP